jgi:IS30 family transposase
VVTTRQRDQDQEPGGAFDQGGDLVFGKGMSPVAALVERSTRYLMLVALPGGNHQADAVADALAAAITTLAEQLAKSLTGDLGHEMAHHQRFTIATGVQVYFCDPKSPWQRGSNEHTHGLPRQYLPDDSTSAR